jgi:hypothetical protein
MHDMSSDKHIRSKFFLSQQFICNTGLHLKDNRASTMDTTDVWKILLHKNK